MRMPKDLCDPSRKNASGRLIPLGERHFRRGVTEYVAHYHLERNHQGLENALIDGTPATDHGRVRRQQRLGGLLNDYRRAA